MISSYCTICIICYNTNRGDYMFFFILQIVVLIGVNTIFYYQAKKYGTYQNHHILLVSVPEKDYHSDEVQNIVSSYQKELFKRYLLTFITYIPLLFFSKFYVLLYYLVIMWLNIMLINFALKKYISEGFREYIRLLPTSNLESDEYLIIAAFKGSQGRKESFASLKTKVLSG